MNLLKLLPLIFIFISGCKKTENTGELSGYTAFTGATIIDGTGRKPVTNGVLLIRNGRIVGVGTKESMF